jgi:hypothetical protein|tara:strand:+ start:129 stop:413 length:285 start_codon:yes stop_codon:yes gene_type:complete
VGEEFLSTLAEQGILGIFCAFLIYLHTQSDKRMARLEEKREGDQRELDSVLDTIAAGVEELLRITKERLQDDKLEKLVRQGSRVSAKTKTGEVR